MKLTDIAEKFVGRINRDDIIMLISLYHAQNPEDDFDIEVDMGEMADWNPATGELPTWQFDFICYAEKNKVADAISSVVEGIGPKTKFEFKYSNHTFYDTGVYPIEYIYLWR